MSSEVINSVFLRVSISNQNDAPTETNIPPKQLFFLDAPEGSGKTIVTTTIQHFQPSRGKHDLEVVSSAVPAQLLDGGRTAHSALKVSVPVASESTSNIEADSQPIYELCEIHLIILNEVFMTHRNNLEAVDCTFCDLR